MPYEQTGFQAALSTDHPLAKVQTEATYGIGRNMATAMISLDCTQAFDSVSHGILSRQLCDWECPEQLYTLLVSFLKDRSVRVRVGDHLSAPFPLTCGVPQGAVLSPVLFNMYTSDIVLE
ncbi:reverse transcriptase domain-containing protein [Klebsiella pneumoniae]|uniref:reverse transcriptase domain-containing protein n=1 Tax=Klebsiella pneumoniae TaxID=573 RepID=UPI00405544ED